MRVLEPPYNQYLETGFQFKRKVRAFHDCVIWSAATTRPVLILEDERHRRVVVFEYDTHAERRQDIQRLLRIPEGWDDGGASSLVPAFVKPGPPSLYGKDARPLPDAFAEDERPGDSAV